ncbi:MAG: D-alanine--D-alanine ligase [Synergistaceae bacterium]|nr:D-alanine--D-alanine ligase [Synergistaceae bacterium]
MEIKHVAVLCGGDSKEREVSLRSGKAVCDALNEAGFSAELFDIRTLAEAEKVKGFDGAFIAMHGDWGENGELQAKLEELGIPYTGSGPKASALAMNKEKSQALFAEKGLPVPEGLVWPVSCEEVIAKLGRDVVVKPCSGGSTVGITIIRGVTPEALVSAAKTAGSSYEGDVLIERYIPGRELTCAVWKHDGHTEALPVIEIAPHTGFYDYSNKYTSGATEYLVPAPISAEESARVRELAVKAHEVLGCSGYSRSDFRLTPEGEAYILEVNTAPGMTATSLVPKAARAVGVSMPDFVAAIMNMAHL